MQMKQITMKKILLMNLLAFLSAGFLSAQSGDLIIKTSSKGLYLEHTVAAKENFYSIGRLYHTHPKNIAAFNGLEMAKGLSLGQSINIPLTDTNFSQTVNQGVPVYYVVGEKEGLMTVSNKNNKVSLADLRHWNHLSNDNLNAGKKLIIGFLVTNEMQDKVVTISERTKAAVPPAEEKKEVAEEIKKPEPEVKKVDLPVVKEEPKKTEPVIVKPEAKPAASAEGYFKTYFNQQIKQSPLTKELTVTSGIFKTTSGWEDAKYYLLIDKVEPGTIVKVINPTNNKAVYAKVLYGMEGIRQNQGYDIRISNAAAAALEITEQDKFIVQVNY